MLKVLVAAVLCATILGSGVAIAHDRDDDHKSTPKPTVRPTATPKATVKPTPTPKPTAAPTIAPTTRPPLPQAVQTIAPAIVIPRAVTTPGAPQIIQLPSTSTQ